MSRAILLGPLAVAALAAAASAAGRNGYSVEAAAGVSSGDSSITTNNSANIYHPYTDFGKTPPPPGLGKAAPGGNAAPSAQDSNDMSSHPERDGVDPTAAATQAAEAEAEKEKEEKPVEFTMADARENFPAVVDTFFRKASEDAVWTRKEGGKARRFSLISADAKRLKALGKGIYSGPALLRDTATRVPTVAEFVVDFSGPEWKVVAAKVAPEAPRRAAPAQR